MNNVIGTAPSAGGPGAEFFTSAYEEEYDTAPGVFTAQAYDAMAVEILAATAAGENNGEAIRDRVRTVANPGGEEFGPENLPEAVETVAAGDPVHYVGASSSVNFDANGDIATAAYDAGLPGRRDRHARHAGVRQRTLGGGPERDGGGPRRNRRRVRGADRRADARNG